MAWYHTERVDGVYIIAVHLARLAGWSGVINLQSIFLVKYKEQFLHIEINEVI
jgi:hypothetical protein